MSLQAFLDSFALLADAPNGVAKLRELILQLAVQGKLDTQNTNDRPVSVLIEGIRNIKAKLIKERRIKPIISAPVSELEKFCRIPQGWTWVRLEEIGQIMGGGTPRSDNPTYFSNNAIAWLTPADLYGLKGKFIGKGKRDISELGLIKSSAQLMPPGTVVFSSRAPIGYVAIASNPVSTNQGFKSCVPYEPDMSEFIYYFLKAVAKRLDENASGTTFKEVPAKQFSQVVMPLPPLEEQKRIVAKVDELMQLCDELEARQQARRESRVRLNNATLAPLNNAASLAPEEFEQAAARLADNFTLLYDSAETVGKLRSTILQLAVQGKLVQQDPLDDPASVLLKRIEGIREASEEKQRKKKTNFPSINPDDEPFTIPSNWLWVRLGQLAKLIEYGTSEKASLDSKGVPVFRMNNIEGGKVLHTNLKYVLPTIKDLPRLYLKNNELLFNRTNSFELVGKTGIFKGESNKFTFASYLIRIRLFDSYVFPDYINLSMNADYFRVTQINSEVTQQCGQANFNGTKLANTLIPLPSLEEQKRIVAKVNQLMALCDELETKLRQAEEDSSRLMKAAVKYVLESVSNTEIGEALSSAV
jgi:type I restriction enzyme S subunit